MLFILSGNPDLQQMQIGEARWQTAGTEPMLETGTDQRAHACVSSRLLGKREGKGWRKVK